MSPEPVSRKRDDMLSFAKEDTPCSPADAKNDGRTYKLLIVDDEKEIHVMTKLVLSDYAYQGAALEFISAYSGEEAKKIIRENPDAALMLLDVVMETRSSGLDVAKFIREVEKNHKIRIILRTGQPGKAPEKDIILNYDINDYKEKTELTTQKLFTTVTTALRSYLHLTSLEEKNYEIAEKNVQLKEEIARRVVAESNLAKYNKSLEKMIDTKSKRLKTAIQSLQKKEAELTKATQMAAIGELSSRSIQDLEQSNQQLKTNLDTINRYREDMTFLLEKYETLQEMIASHLSSDYCSQPDTLGFIKAIKHFKTEIDLEQILKEYPHIIEDSNRGIDLISSAVSDIQIFMAIQKEPKDKTDINRLIKQILKEISTRFDSHIDLQTDLSTVPVLQAGAQTLQKALYEIIKNSFEAVGKKGIISISSRQEEDKILINISDTGHGIASESLTSIFRPYFSTRPGSKGLGLPYARNVIVSLGGLIQLTSQLREGTSISISMPVCPFPAS